MNDSDQIRLHPIVREQIDAAVRRHPLPPGVTDTDLEERVWECLESSLRKRGLPADPRHVRNLVHRVIRQRACDLARRNRRKTGAHFVTESAGEGESHCGDSKAAFGAWLRDRGAEEAIDSARRRLVIVGAAAASIPNAQRILQAMHDRADEELPLTQHAIARHAGCSQAAVSRALAGIREALQGSPVVNDAGPNL